jgi:hypothetical protein
MPWKASSVMEERLRFVARLTSTWSRKPCNPSTTRSARGCHPCLRYGLLPMCPGRTRNGVAERVGFEPTVRFPAHTLSKRAP